ncbi:MAG: hypothetical protein KY434_04370 [Actinobacteria bacterium]|nr:hypothetical protein [Actinomycetota bacterium]
MEVVTQLHGYVVGFLVVGSWATVCGWSLALWRLRYASTPTFWRVVSVAQVLLGVQLLLGLLLLAVGARPGTGTLGDLAFHLAYGAVFPLLAMFVGHGLARAGRYHPHAVFAVVGLVNFGLAMRAWQVGAFGA